MHLRDLIRLAGDLEFAKHRDIVIKLDGELMPLAGIGVENGVLCLYPPSKAELNMLRQIQSGELGDLSDELPKAG